MDERAECAEIRELLPELAAGVAAGDERGRALAHLGGCSDCRRELEALATAADELIALARPVEPPPGFESAVLAKIAPPRAVRLRRRAFRPAIAVALASAIGLGLGAVSTLQITQDDRQLAGAYRRTLQIAGGRFLAARGLTAPDASRAGTVFAYQGTPSWVFVVVWSGASDGPYQIDLLTRDGLQRRLGTMVVTGGEGSWGVKIDLDVAQIAEIKVSGAAPPLTAAFR
jgi:Putative zinc-finger